METGADVKRLIPVVCRVYYWKGCCGVGCLLSLDDVLHTVDVSDIRLLNLGRILSGVIFLQKPRRAVLDGWQKQLNPQAQTRNPKP